ncbi:SMP-30/gluconolactonase/LRE family protein [Massilia terrae]|uniref:SMP-30/gluconolactonase/LRE family protein n=1 Tax=Massilia terrae TaxID=1811224 RepID=A0ABT2CYR4_9BURK|nr:SMP-30/gluconolactonase/LRE family protein [Massilia terrae]MCS0659102.1 SMP-30/gluconolactonase/LRE family protein [Massilia terrae]
MMTPTSLWEVEATLGEGVLWHAATGRVWFVDIKKNHIHSCAADGSERRTWTAPSQVSAVVPVEGGGWVVSLEDGLYRFDEASGQFTLLRAVEADLPGNRFNDAFVDAAGRLWFGSMDNGEKSPTGSLYSYNGRDVKQADSGYIITNGPATSPDGRTLYHTDTLDKRTYAFDLAADGSLSNKRLFAHITEGGHPDGMAVDAEGHVWIAVFRGWRIDRYAPDGRKVGSVRFPCSNITKLAFGGGDLRTVWVTTARKGLSEEELAQQPLAGALFTFRADVPGLAQHALRLEEQA